MSLSRRGFVGGLISALAAPAIVRIASIMPVKVMPPAEELATIGVVPAKQIVEELYELTRQAFVPRLAVQLYKATPLMSLLYEKYTNPTEVVAAVPRVHLAHADFE